VRQKSESSRGARAVLWIVLAALVAVGCGNRLSRDDLYAAANAGATGAATGSTVAGASASAGAPDAVGDTTTTVAGQITSGQPSQATAATVGGSTGPATAGPATAGAAACTKSLTPITIASVGQQSGLIGALTVSGTKGVQAWVAMANARGGVNCHPVKYLVADDGGDPSRHQALVQEMVEQRGVQAFVYQDAVLTGQASVDYLTRKGIPVVGTENSGEFVYNSPMYFPQASSGNFLLEQPMFAAADSLKAKGLTRTGLLTCLEAAQCGVARANFDSWTRQAGLTPVYNAQASLATGDFTSNCQGAQAAGVQALVTDLDASSNSRLARSCDSIGYKPVLVSNGQAATQNSLADPRLNGFLLGVQVRPPFGAANPAVDAFKAAMAKYAPGIPVDTNVMVGWVAAKLFEAATTHLSEPPTSASVLAGLWSIKNDDLGGLTYPITFTKGQNAPRVFCYWLMAIQDGKFVSPNGGQRACT
jgi:branched-chain amino acid transport system substrate-binding protein